MSPTPFLLSPLPRLCSISLAVCGVVCISYHELRHVRRRIFRGQILSPLQPGGRVSCAPRVLLPPLCADRARSITRALIALKRGIGTRDSSSGGSSVRTDERSIAVAVPRSSDDEGGMADDFQDMAERTEERSWAGRGGRHRGGGRRGGGGGGGLSRQVQISKALSTLLRHQAQNAGIQLDAEGFAPLDRVVSDTQPSLFFFHLFPSFSIFDYGFIYE